MKKIIVLVLLATIFTLACGYAGPVMATVIPPTKPTQVSYTPEAVVVVTEIPAVLMTTTTPIEITDDHIRAVADAIMTSRYIREDCEFLVPPLFDTLPAFIT